MLKNNFILSYNKKGSGRAIVLIFKQHSQFAELAEDLSEKLSDLGQIFVVALESFDYEWKAALASLQGFLDSSGIRNASFVAFEQSTILLQALVLRKPKLVRSLIFIDPATREKSSKFFRWIEKLENYLPLGLPFRSDFEGFDGKPFLQRIRCPMLLVLRTTSDEYLREQVQVMNKAAPTSFFSDLGLVGQEELKNVLENMIRKFFEVPAKFPQKNLKYA